jgi:putative endonuclease
MSTINQQLGVRGEKEAKHFLLYRGYSILEMNLRIGRAEIDIVALHKEQIVFVEVKTRANLKNGYPEDAVGRRKEKMMIEAANSYCLDHETIGGIRFDIISIILINGRCEIMHFKDAILPWS